LVQRHDAMYARQGGNRKSAGWYENPEEEAPGLAGAEVWAATS
jgi:hypothetical protein